MHKKLSVVVPVYNSEKYLKRALQSVLQQTFPVYEVICVDDGSTDESLGILNRYVLEDKRVKVFRKENGGPTSARKAGIGQARGDYVAFVDADDFIEPVMYEKLMGLADEYNADMVTSGFIRDYGNHVTVNDEKIRPGVYNGSRIKTGILGQLVNQSVFYETGISPSLCNKIFRADKLKPVQMCVDDRIAIGDDDAVIYPFLFRSSSIVVSGSSYYHYCIRENSAVMGVRREDDTAAVHLLLEYLEKEFRDADMPGLNLMRQFCLLRESFLMLRNVPEAVYYDGEFLYPYGKIRKTDKILLYGAGKLGVELREYLEQEGFFIVGWADRSSNREGIIRPNMICQVEFDYVIISVLIADVVQQIREELKMMGILDEKILYADVRLMGEYGYQCDCAVVQGTKICRKNTGNDGDKSAPDA